MRGYGNKKNNSIEETPGCGTKLLSLITNQIQSSLSPACQL
jgi:hypothetical protein